MVAEIHDHERVDELLTRALQRSPSGQAEVLYTARDQALTRFANCRIHQNVSGHDASLRVRLVDAGRTGVASTNRLDAEGLREVVARAATIREHAAPNPEQAALPERDGQIDGMLGYVPATDQADPDLRAAGARAVIAAGESSGLNVSGAFSTETSTVAVANSNGVRGAHTTTQAKLITVMMGERGASGYAQAASGDVRAIDASAVGEEAADKALRSADAGDLEPGEYEVILEEYAVATLLEYLSFDGFSALALQEGRSFMELGQRVMGPNVSIWDDGQDPSGLPSAIDFEGVVKQRVDLVTEGIATGVVHDAATAQRAATTSTGHALPSPNPWGPISWNLFMAPGSSSKEAMLANTERGIWVTRFHYVNIVHPKKAILTGMTKDGTFLIEHGRIVRPLRNFRFTQSIPEAFSTIDAISSQTRLIAAEYSGINARVPALRIGRFNFTGVTGREEGA
ncbi:MAG TPA: TldD/PmbA family protein [Candidatus Limnocylindria bacterium]|nr:TldD/PmbA family protein [Candidatus Limnocylindria bacterium]